MAVKIHGKEYATVAERVTAAHAAGGFSILATEVLALGADTGRWYVRVQIQYGGKRYIGMSELPRNAKPGSPEATAPLEVAETSALGRALAFAGFGVDGSIASADELRQVGVA